MTDWTGTPREPEPDEEPEATVEAEVEEAPAPPPAPAAPAWAPPPTPAPTPAWAPAPTPPVPNPPAPVPPMPDPVPPAPVPPAPAPPQPDPVPPAPVPPAPVPPQPDPVPPAPIDPSPQPWTQPPTQPTPPAPPAPPAFESVVPPPRWQDAAPIVERAAEPAASVVDAYEPVVTEESERDEPEAEYLHPQSLATQAVGQMPKPFEEVVFNCANLSSEARRHLSMRLRGADIAHRWEVATELVVSTQDAGLIDSFIEEAQNPDGFADEELEDFDEDVDDEAIYAAMSSLYVAADRLMQKPGDASARTAFYDATDDVEELGAPFGFDPRVWIEVQDLTDKIADAMDAEADEVGIGENARTLRQILVNYV